MQKGHTLKYLSWFDALSLIISLASVLFTCTATYLEHSRGPGWHLLGGWPLALKVFFGQLFLLLLLICRAIAFRRPLKRLLLPLISAAILLQPAFTGVVGRARQAGTDALARQVIVSDLAEECLALLQAIVAKQPGEDRHEVWPDDWKDHHQIMKICPDGVEIFHANEIRPASVDILHAADNDNSVNSHWMLVRIAYGLQYILGFDGKMNRWVLYYFDGNLDRNIPVAVISPKNNDTEPSK